MGDTRIGETKSGKIIKVQFGSMESHRYDVLYKDFEVLDLFDVWLACEYLAVREKRRDWIDGEWKNSLERVIFFCTRKLGGEKIAKIKMEKGITSAFEAHDYGKSLIYPHFQAHE